MLMAYVILGCLSLAESTPLIYQLVFLDFMAFSLSF